MVEMQVIGLTLDEETKVPIIMLRSQDAGLNLQIIVAPLEGMSISMALHQLGSRRSFTHELALRILDILDAKLLAVEIYQFKPGVFSADLLIESGNGATTRLDSRPADAVVLALGAKIPILVSKELLADQGSAELPSTEMALRFKHLASLDSLKSGVTPESRDIRPTIPGEQNNDEQNNNDSLEQDAGPDSPQATIVEEPVRKPKVRTKFQRVTISLVAKPETGQLIGQADQPDAPEAGSALPGDGGTPQDQQSLSFGTAEERQKWLENVAAQAKAASGTEEEKRWRDILNNFEPVSKYKM